MTGPARKLIDELRLKQDIDTTLGQHFLHDENILDSILDVAGDLSSRHVLEIGPGPGVLTERLIDASLRVTAIEIDEGICEHLQRNFPELNLIEGDCLEIDWPEGIDTVIANIPYQISSPLIEIITQEPAIDLVVIMVQEEFAQRLCVETIADRGSLGMSVMLDWNTSMKTKVAPHQFIPQPQVHSRIVLMKRRNAPSGADLAKLMIRQTFSQRRKKLRNTLKSPPPGIQRLPGWDHSVWKVRFSEFNHPLLDERPERLSEADWLELAHVLENI